MFDKEEMIIKAMVMTRRMRRGHSPPSPHSSSSPFTFYSPLSKLQNIVLDVFLLRYW
jgi:hypothetical protein